MPDANPSLNSISANAKWIAAVAAGIVALCMPVLYVTAIRADLTADQGRQRLVDEAINRSVAEDVKRIDLHEQRLVSQEQYGHPDHEKRITKLENFAEKVDQNQTEILRKQDVMIERLGHLPGHLPGQRSDGQDQPGR